MAQNPLRELNRLGQSVWQDYIRRDELLSGELAKLIAEDGVSGLTSNPSIFQKAIAAGQDYDQSIRQYVAEGLEGPALFERLAVEDIQNACDLMRPAYDATKARDGFVSIEVSPRLARETQASLDEARRLWKTVNRPNLMVKIPGTREGLPAIQEALSEGININITLLFAVERYVEVAEAYLAALEKRAADGQPVDRVASVASFFVSRIDSLLDKQLEANLGAASGDAKKLIGGLLGKVAVANAKAAYQEYRRLFDGPRFEALKKKGAGVQRVLWASTSTKNPKYSDVLYVEDLIGPQTVNTLPPETMKAFRDHGKARLTLEEGVDEARRVLSSLPKAGVDLAAATRQLEEDGIRLFAEAYDKLLKGLEEKRQAMTAAGAAGFSAALGKLAPAVEETLEKLDGEKFASRLAARDAALWKQDPEHQKIIRNALGWLNISESMLKHVDELTGFADQVRKEGYGHVVVLGMGGSSLCPDVCRETFGARPGYPQLEVLDSTVPGAIKRLEESLDPAKTLFLVSSKSGGTTETLSFFKYFYERVRQARGERAGENFVAITDPGTALERLAAEKEFRRVFPGTPDIGGRYSALSNFGMVPAALAGVNVRALLEQAERMRRGCSSPLPAKQNPGLSLGATLGAAAQAGRDKVTFFASPGVRGFENWVEQLIAESTGKEGKGILPVAGEKIGTPEVYGDDRLFVHIELADEMRERFDPKVQALEDAGHPLLHFVLNNKLELGQEFYRWEVATAAAGSLLGIDAFDQPNVQESKDNTKRLLEQFRSTGKLPEEAPYLVAGEVKLYGCPGTASPQTKDLGACLTAFFAQARPGDYVALMAYLEPAPIYKALSQALRIRLRDALRLATTLGFGPRFLHSTGQLHKGGAANGLFIQITGNDAEDLPVPGEPYTFSVLKQAQALGDLEALRSRQRRVIRLHVGPSVQAGLDELTKLLESAVAAARH